MAQDPRYKAIKKARAEGQTLKAIGDQWGISRERVRQILIRPEPKPRPKSRRKPGKRKPNPTLPSIVAEKDRAFVQDAIDRGYDVRHMPGSRIGIFVPATEWKIIPYKG